MGEDDRARALLEVAINEPMLDMPEKLWNGYIQFERDLGEYDRTRDLYERMLERTKHVKVWMSYAAFEAEIAQVQAARAVYQRGYDWLKQAEANVSYLVGSANELEWDVLCGGRAVWGTAGQASSSATDSVCRRAVLARCRVVVQAD